MEDDTPREALRRAEADATYVRKDVYAAKHEILQQKVDALFAQKDRMAQVFIGGVVSLIVGVLLMVLAVLVKSS